MIIRWACRISEFSESAFMENILIIDDDQMMCKAMASLISRMGHQASYCCSLKEGLEIALSDEFAVVFLDVLMPDGSGLDLLPKIKETPSRPEVIIVTAYGDPDGAELAIKSGAWDYIEKKASITEMMLPLSRALQYRKEKLSTVQPVALKRENIIGNTPKMETCFNLMAKAAISDANVLITGETGTGKELFARAIHDNSRRRDGSFIVVDCAALPEFLVESILFGHEKGAFTGADRTRQGLIQQADGGSLFLDEVGELSLDVQKSFLRVLHEHRFRPIGGSDEIHSNFRLITATNKSLDTLTDKGKFRQDLLYRLRSLSFELPPLRHRVDDIKDLARFHITRLCDQYGIETKGFSPEFFDVLKSYDWPGNVRELFNTLEGALAEVGREPTLFSKHLPMHIRVRKARASVGENRSSALSKKNIIPSIVSLPTLRNFRLSMEKQYVHDLIEFTKHDLNAACRISGMSRSRLYELLSKHNIIVSAK